MPKIKTFDGVPLVVHEWLSIDTPLYWDQKNSKQFENDPRFETARRLRRSYFLMTTAEKTAYDKAWVSISSNSKDKDNDSAFPVFLMLPAKPKLTPFGSRFGFEYTSSSGLKTLLKVRQKRLDAIQIVIELTAPNPATMLELNLMAKHSPKAKAAREAFAKTYQPFQDGLANLKSSIEESDPSKLAYTSKIDSKDAALQSYSVEIASFSRYLKRPCFTSLAIIGNANIGSSYLNLASLKFAAKRASQL